MTYQRKTKDCFVVQTMYDEKTWEDTTEEETHKLGRLQVACYRANQPQFRHRLIVRREKIA